MTPRRSPREACSPGRARGAGGRLGAATALWLLACSPANPGDPTPDATTPDPPEVTTCADDPGASWDGFAHGFFLDYCQACHASANTIERFGAPAADFFDTEAAVAARADRVRARVLDEQTMPVGGGVNPDDRSLLDVYLRCTLGR